MYTEIITDLLEQLVYKLSAEYGLIYIFNDKNKSATCRFGIKHDLTPEIDMSSIPGIFRVLSSSDPLFLSKPFNQELQLTKEDTKWFSQQACKSLAILPVPMQRVLGGFLILANYDSKYIDQPDAVVEIQSITRILGKMLSAHPDVGGLSSVHDSSVFENIFDSSDHGKLYFGPNGKVEACNQMVAKIFDKPKSFFVDKHLADIEEIFPKGILATMQRDIGMIKMGSESIPQEITIKDAQNQAKIIEISTKQVQRVEAGSGILIIFRDITHTKDMEISVQESETKLRRVIESVKEGIILSDDTGYFEIYNPEMESLTGYSRDEANQSQNFIDLIYRPENRAKAWEQLHDFKLGETRTSEMHLHSKSGDAKIVNVSTTRITADNKHYFLSAFHDLSAQKEAERLLTEARDHLEEKVEEQTKELRAKVYEVENLARFPSEDPFPVLRISQNGDLLYANAASKVLLDVWQTAVGEAVPREWRDLVLEVFDSNKRKIHEIEISGQHISFALTPVLSGGYVNLYGRDVSREKELDLMKNQFIAMVSHQVRTPLTSVRWYSEMLLKGKNENKLNPKQAEITETIHTTAISLTELVNDLLSISRMESGKIAYAPTRQSIIDVISQVVQEMKPHADKGEVALDFHEIEIEPFSFDPKLLTEVYRNLLSNAIKYTPKNGSVTLSLQLENDILTSSITDTGMGIPQDQQADIFQRFYRAQNAVDSGLEGTGLGLSVVKMIVEKAGGKIWFTSTVGEGTTFSFTLPTKNVI